MRSMVLLSFQCFTESHCARGARNWRAQGQGSRARAAPPRWLRPLARSAQRAALREQGEGAQRHRGVLLHLRFTRVDITWSCVLMVWALAW